MGNKAPVDSFMLPAVLRDDREAGGVRSRTMRDWLVDSLVFTLSILWALISVGYLLMPDVTTASQFEGSPQWLVGVDLTLGVAFSVALWWRRRWPVQLALLSVLVCAWFITPAVAMMALVFTVAVHRTFTQMLWLAAAAFVSNAVFYAFRPEQGATYLESVGWGTLFLIIAVLWGATVRARRQLVLSLRERAERAEAEQQMRVERARALERNRIAREMHDVLAHRIAQLSLYAGGLEMSRDKPVTAKVAESAAIIRQCAQETMADLRYVIGVLREPGDGTIGDRPQPTLGDLAALVAESAAAGARISFDLAVGHPARVPAGTGRTVYRIVQEGLTNARKHAPGTIVRVGVAGDEQRGLSVDIRNPAPVNPPALPPPGTGTGLIGLTERAELAGGTLSHGKAPGGEFVLQAWLPWPADAATSAGAGGATATAGADAGVTSAAGAGFAGATTDASGMSGVGAAAEGSPDAAEVPGAPAITDGSAVGAAAVAGAGGDAAAEAGRRMGG